MVKVSSRGGDPKNYVFQPNTKDSFGHLEELTRMQNLLLDVSYIFFFFLNEKMCINIHVGDDPFMKFPSFLKPQMLM